MLNVACCTLQVAQLCSDCDDIVDYCGRARGGELFHKRTTSKSVQKSSFNSYSNT